MWWRKRIDRSLTTQKIDIRMLMVEMEYAKDKISELEFKVEYMPKIGETFFAIDGNNGSITVDGVIVGELYHVNGCGKMFTLKVDKDQYPDTDGYIWTSKIYPISQLGDACASLGNMEYGS